MRIVPAPDSFSLSEGAVFHDHYEVVRRIDSGAMGTVYEVVDQRTKRKRALKIMLARFADNPDVTERFRREATITAEVVSEHVVETFDAGVDAASHLPFLVMELLRGEDLGKMVARGPLPHADVVTLLMQAATALDKMHACAVIHRDLKPENLFVTRRDDGAPLLKILDFGIAKVVEKSAPSATTTRNMGTPVYMSPEQVTGAGTVGPPADLYAVGQLAYTMLTGEPYWLEDALAHETVYPLLLRIMEGAVEPATERAARTRKVTVPPGFDDWFAKATAREPEDRFTTAAESIIALAAALDVPRPMLPSALLSAALATAPTQSPPTASAEAFPLLPAPPPSRKTPSPPAPPRTTPSAPSTPSRPSRKRPRLPRARPAQEPHARRRRPRRPLLRRRRGRRRPLRAPPAPRHGPPPTGAAAGDPTSVRTGTSEPAPAPSAEPTAVASTQPPAPSAEPTAQPSATASATAAAAPVKRPYGRLPQPTKPPPRPTRPYGDPTRDL
ncbi:MAG: protein kinase [Polyangiaceae bacterium]